MATCRGHRRDSTGHCSRQPSRAPDLGYVGWNDGEGVPVLPALLLPLLQVSCCGTRTEDLVEPLLTSARTAHQILDVFGAWPRPSLCRYSRRSCCASLRHHCTAWCAQLWRYNSGLLIKPATPAHIRLSLRSRLRTRKPPTRRLRRRRRDAH